MLKNNKQTSLGPCEIRISRDGAWALVCLASSLTNSGAQRSSGSNLLPLRSLFQLSDSGEWRSQDLTSFGELLKYGSDISSVSGLEGKEVAMAHRATDEETES